MKKRKKNSAGKEIRKNFREKMTNLGAMIKKMGKILEKDELEEEPSNEVEVISPEMGNQTRAREDEKPRLSSDPQDEDRDGKDVSILEEEEEESLNMDLPSWMDEESKRFNKQMLAAWREQRMNWR